MKIVIIVLFSFSLASPVGAQVALNVNQTHTLSWTWENDGSPVRDFVFRCGLYTKQIVDADARSLRFGSLIEAPGSYSGCTLSARNEAGLSAPVVIPDFEYSYSYTALGLFGLECAAMLMALAGIVSWSRQRVVQMMAHVSPVPALALPEPIIILQKERDHVHHDS